MSIQLTLLTPHLQSKFLSYFKLASTKVITGQINLITKALVTYQGSVSFAAGNMAKQQGEAAINGVLA